MEGKEHAVLNMLHGMNEMHPTLGIWSVRPQVNECEVHVLSQMLAQAKQYRVEPYITETVEFAGSRDRFMTGYSLRTLV